MYIKLDLRYYQATETVPIEVTNTMNTEVPVAPTTPTTPMPREAQDIEEDADPRQVAIRSIRNSMTTMHHQMGYINRLASIRSVSLDDLQRLDGYLRQGVEMIDDVTAPIRRRNRQMH
ncbi:hypothetical protein [Absidia glauca]|uniref:Uncharacterized protein n=1 Tax=Absidia glauca TaxID=4829 RepID=A0A168Q754_ABSGL|nr:hypothetical protein [Absidia glauca]